MGFLLILELLIVVSPLLCEDWPEWRGKGRTGVWLESGILDTFPPEGLAIRWRTPVRSGFAGPAVASGKVFLADFLPSQNVKGIERALCLDEKTGRIQWTREWPVDYAGLQQRYAIGPRATPTVDGDRVYFQGAKGALFCLDTKDGSVLWQKDYVKDYQTRVPVWGAVGAPLVDGNKLICLAGGDPDAKVVAFDKMTGEELWRALSSEQSEPGYCPPILIEAGGRRQVIIWHPGAVVSLDPDTGKVFWEQLFRVRSGLTVATPVLSRGMLLVSSFYNGSMMLDLDPQKPRAALRWKGKSDSEIKTDGLHALTSTPVIDGGYIYGICSYGQFRCLDARTGERQWETLEVTGEQARWATGLIVRHQDRYFINNDRGDLIIAKLSPEGYREMSRTRLIEPTSDSGNKRELGAINWSHPAYANKSIYARNDKEIIAASLAK